jgi:hypothetical protein
MLTLMYALAGVSFLTSCLTSLKRFARLQWSNEGTLLALATLSLVVAWHWSTQGDLRVYCDARSAYNAGLDPYIVDNLRKVGNPHSLGYAYPLAHAWLFVPLCANPHLLGPVFGGICLLITYLIVAPPAGLRLYLLVLLLGGAAAATWNVATGNIGLIEMLLFALATQLFERHHRLSSAVILGVMASFKLVPLALVLPFAWVAATADSRPRTRAGASLLLVATTACVAAILVSAILDWNEFSQYLRQVTGSLPSQHSPVHETIFSAATPTPVLLLLPLSMQGTEISTRVLFGISAVLVPLLFLAAARTGKRFSLGHLELLSLMTIAVFISLPRVKPYSFSLVMISLYYLSRDAPRVIKNAILVAVCTYPIVGYWLADGGDEGYMAAIAQPVGLALASALCLGAHRCRLRGRARALS